MNNRFLITRQKRYMNVNPQYTDLVKTDTKEPRQVSYAQGMHPNPRFYKYYWRVFHHQSEEGKLFFKSPALTTNAMHELCERLRNENKGYMLYNWSRPRIGDDVPFNFNSPRWRGCFTAPAYDEDSDIPWRGHK